MEKPTKGGYIVFPALDAGFRNRKKAYRACLQCKKARRRCKNEGGTINDEEDRRCIGCKELEISCSFQEDSTTSERVLYRSRLRRSAKADLSSTRFFSHMDPSSDLLAAEGDPDKDQIGIWIPQIGSINGDKGSAADYGGESSSNVTVSSSRPSSSVNTKTSASFSSASSASLMAFGSPVLTGFPTSSNRDSTNLRDKVRRLDQYKSPPDASIYKQRIPVDRPKSIGRYLLSHLNSVEAFELPPKHIKNQLIEIFFKHMHPLLPIVDEISVRMELEQGTASLPLVHAIILCACRHPSAVSILKFNKTHESDRGFVRSFAASIYCKIEALLYAKVETSPLTLTRIHALASFHAEGNEGFRGTITHMSLAFAYAHSQAIHLSGGENSAGEHSATLRLWRSLWCLDRICSICNSAPILSNVADYGINVWNDYENTNLSWTAEFIKYIKLLDDCLYLYRPTTPSDRRTIPASIEAYAANPLSYPHIDTKSPFHAISKLQGCTAVILAYKRGKSVLLNEEQVSSLLIQTALEIYSLVEGNDLPPFQIVPYSVTLCLTVFLKYFPLVSVRPHWRRGCDILDSLSIYWYAAEAMSSMSRRVFEKLEKDYEEMEESIQNQLNDLFDPANDIFDTNVLSSFATQTDLFAEFDRKYVDSWFS